MIIGGAAGAALGSEGLMAETPFGVLVGQLARANPDCPAVTCEEVTISRAELEARTNRLARVYRDLGVTPDSLVTIGLANGIAFFWVVTPTYYHQPQVDPWLVGDVTGTRLCGVIARWDDATWEARQALQNLSGGGTGLATRP